MSSRTSHTRVVRWSVRLCGILLLSALWLSGIAHLTTAAPATPAHWSSLQGTINQEAKIAASDGTTGSYFGHSIAMSGNTMVIGAVATDIGTNNNQGAAYVFEYDSATTTWNQVKKLIASDGAAEDLFGTAVGIDGDTIVVGAGQADLPGGMWGPEHDHGAAYVFERNGAAATTGAK